MTNSIMAFSEPVRPYVTPCRIPLVLLLYRKGFALLPFKNGVEIAAVESGTASIDGHAVPKGQEWPCRDPGTDGGALEPRRDVRG